MKAAVLKEYNKPFQYVEDRPVPEVGDDDVLVRIKAAGFCHTDLQVNQGGSATRALLAVLEARAKLSAFSITSRSTDVGLCSPSVFYGPHRCI